MIWHVLHDLRVSGRRAGRQGHGGRGAATRRSRVSRSATGHVGARVATPRVECSWYTRIRLTCKAIDTFTYCDLPSGTCVSQAAASAACRIQPRRSSACPLFPLCEENPSPCPVRCLCLDSGMGDAHTRWTRWKGRETLKDAVLRPSNMSQFVSPHSWWSSVDTHSSTRIYARNFAHFRARHVTQNRTFRSKFSSQDFARLCSTAADYKSALCVGEATDQIV